MTAVASALAFPQVSRSSWGTINGNIPMNPDEVRGMFPPRKNLARSSSSSSISSDSSNTSVATNGSHSNGTSLSSTSDTSQWSANGPQRKRPQPKNPWPTGKIDMSAEFSRVANGRPNGMLPHSVMQQSVGGGGQAQLTPQGMMRGPGPEQSQGGQPVLYLLSMNGTFERKTIVVPFAPDSLRIGRQTNQKTVPTPTNGFFDSKVLSRQHAEIYAERNGKIFIRDVKSSNGTFVNGTRLSQENRESEPHELQTADHLELGIDIVSEDQKTVVHHKVAAKIEHAGFLAASNNVLDMSFGDLDPANGSMMMPPGQMQTRGRQVNNNNNNMGPNGRIMQNGPMPNPQPNGMTQQRPFFVPPIATDQIMKRLATEMRNAKLQGQDLSRTNQFVTTLLSKDDIKDLEKAETQEAPKPSPMVNGSGIALRTDAKTRFSDPPAPPPQQPLPEKPDVPSLKRAAGERPKSGPTLSSPIRQDNLSQIIQLTEALNNAKRDIDTQSARMRELEAMLDKEREARAFAEDLAMRLEESAKSQMNGSAVTPANAEETLAETTVLADSTEEIAEPLLEESKDLVNGKSDVDNVLQTRLSTMEAQVNELRDQMELWKARCEAAETERDTGRKSLAEMVTKLREEEARRQAAEEKVLSSSMQLPEDGSGASSLREAPIASSAATEVVNDESTKTDEPEKLEESPTLSRANTITPLNAHRRGSLQDDRLYSGLPYASMLGVVLIGMGMMAVINGWQSPPSRLER
ncbi:cytoplasm to vacuole targeting Vps64 [Cordyceps militaris]|uniref:Cytoplasm to vacuole targeting Vps64 n=1 Tax=Cordyceps militaris TaxID=73501 RepID=A0A2H4S929_CORMI|nr:cytoplasm to vacuole targeting Vps64 [Cordyceps militaris]